MLELINHGKIREIRLARPPANALNGPLVEALDDALRDASETADAVVVSGLPGMFSAGLDVPELLGLDRPVFTRLWHHFIGVQRTIAGMAVPTAFALTGHAPAGGILLALSADFRVMCDGDFKTGLNEVRIGLVVPEPAFGALRRLIGPSAAGRVVLDGDLMTSRQAAEIGLVDELAPTPEAVVERAVAWCEEQLGKPAEAMRLTRLMGRRDLRALFDDYDETRDERFVDMWFSEATQATLRHMVANLKKR